MGKHTVITAIDEGMDHYCRDGAKALQRRFPMVSDFCAWNQVISGHRSSAPMLIIVSHGSTILKGGGGHVLGKYVRKGREEGGFIILACCEGGLFHKGMQLDSMGQQLANTTRAKVWSPNQFLPHAAVYEGLAFYQSPIFEWVQASNGPYGNLWSDFSPQSDVTEISTEISNLFV